MANRALTAFLPDTLRDDLLRERRKVPAEKQARVRCEWILNKEIQPSLLLRNHFYPHFFLKERDTDITRVGLGCFLQFISADYSATANALQYIYAQEDSYRVYGGLRFDPVRKADPVWSGYPAARWVIPELEWEFHPDRMVLYWNMIRLPEEQSDEEALDELLRKLGFVPSGSVPDEAASGKISFQPNRDEWSDIFQKAQGAFRNGELEKVVLARKATLMKSISPVDCLNTLDKPETSFLFYIRFDEQSSFLGRTPEMLFRRENGILHSEAIAGNRPRSEVSEKNKISEEDLLSSEKDIHEHALVVGFLKEAFDNLCTEVHLQPENSLRVLQRVHHLYRKIQGTLHPEVNDFEILTRLHPTPALGGKPRETALAFLRDHELLDRGWYGAPIGYLSAESSLMLVAIRSALVTLNDITLFSGVGVVPQSNEDAEWNELDAKIRHFTEILK